MIDKLKAIYLNISGKGFFHLLTANFLIFFLGFFSQLAVAWILPVEDMARIKTLQSFLSIFTVFSTFGFNTSVLKLTSEKRDEREKQYLFKKSISYTVISSLFTYFSVLILAYFKILSNDSLVNILSPFYFLLLIPLSLNSIFTSFFQGMKKFKLISKIQIYSKFIAIVSLIICSYYFYIQGYVIGMILGFSLTSCFFIFYISGTFKNVKVQTVNNPFKIHLKYSGYSALSNLLAVIASNIDILVLSYLAIDMVQFGYYSFAVTLMVVLRIIPQTIQQVTIPYFSEKSNNRELWLSSVKKYFILSQFINITIVSFVFFFSPLIINFLYNGKYDNSIFYFKIILIGWFFRGAYNILGAAIIGLGDIRFNFINGLIIAILNSFLMFFLIKYYNIQGAAWANAIGGIFAFLIISIRFYTVYVFKTTNIKS